MQRFNESEAHAPLTAQPEREESRYRVSAVQQAVAGRASLAADFSRRLAVERRIRPAVADELLIGLATSAKLFPSTERRPLSRGAEVVLGMDDYTAFNAYRSRFPSEKIRDPRRELEERGLAE